MPAATPLRVLLLVAVIALTGCGSAAPTPQAPPPALPTTAGSARIASSAPPSAARPHILLIMEENRGYAATLGDCAADPYLCSLAHAYASLTRWYGVTHPSLPNYLASVSGSTQGCTSDGCAIGIVGPSLGTQLTAAHIPWTAYMESMPHACDRSGSVGTYAMKHNPFVYFSALTPAICTAHVLPYPGAAPLTAALNGPGAPDFVWISPNVNNDMHSGSVAAGDQWLHTNLPGVLSSAWFAHGGTVIITMDESDADGGACCGDAAGGHIPTVVISAAARGRGVIANSGDHYGTLRTIESAFGLTPLGAAANPANGSFPSLIAAG